MLRTLLLSTLALALFGCGKPAPAPSGEPVILEASIPPAPVADAGHEMDPAKHSVPAALATGMLGGRAFTPDRVALEGKSLTFRRGAIFFADQQITIFFADYKPTDAVKLTVKPTQKWHEGKTPSLHISQRQGEDLPNNVFVNDGYALTLELAPRQDGKIAGSIYLSLPGGQMDYLAGTFTAVYDRELSDPPEADDRPYIAGRISHSGKPKQSLVIRYAALPAAGGDPISDMVGSQVVQQGGISAVRSTTNAPRVVSLRPGKMGEEYDCARLPPGKYFLVVRLDDGPPGWKLVDVVADSKIDAPLAIPTAPAGNVEVTVPGKFGGQVQAIPSGLKLDDPTGAFTTSVSGALGAYGNVADGKASLKNLAPGKYDVSLRTGSAVYRAEVVVESGRTAKVELK